MSLILEAKTGGDFKPHPEGIHPALCVDVIDLGMVQTEFQGEVRIVPKLRLVFESEQRTDEGANCTISKSFTASLHPKAKLADFLGKWRGRPVVPGEKIDLAKLIGASCTLVISHQQNMVGRTYASIDAVSKPTKKLTASGHYDPAAARQRIAEWKARDAVAAPKAPTPAPHRGGDGSSPLPHQQSTMAGPARVNNQPLKTPAPAQPDFDPEVGF